jgi:hypothetical protein
MAIDQRRVSSQATIFSGRVEPIRVEHIRIIEVFRVTMHIPYRRLGIASDTDIYTFTKAHTKTSVPAGIYSPSAMNRT